MRKYNFIYSATLTPEGGQNRVPVFKKRRISTDLVKRHIRENGISLKRQTDKGSDEH
jgi:hypothetical protein